MGEDQEEDVVGLDEDGLAFVVLARREMVFIGCQDLLGRVEGLYMLAVPEDTTKASP